MAKAPSNAEQPGDAPSGFVLEPRLGVHHAGALLEGIRTLRGRDLDVDASGVEMASTPCLQVLLSAARTWREDQRQLRTINPSTGLLTVLSQLGIDLSALQSQETPPWP